MYKLKNLLVVTSLCLGLVEAALFYAQGNNYSTSTEWPTFGHDSGDMRYSPLTQITPANVGTLHVAWVYHLKPVDYVAPAGRGRGGGGGSGFQASEGTPLVADGLMYISSPYGRVVALDATTGKEVWVYKLPSGSPATRGVEFFEGDQQTPPQIVVTTSDSKMFTLDAKTGALNTKFGVDAFVTLDKAPSSPAVMYNNLIIVSGRAQENSGPG